MGHCPNFLTIRANAPSGNLTHVPHKIDSLSTVVVKPENDSLGTPSVIAKEPRALLPTIGGTGD